MPRSVSPADSLKAPRITRSERRRQLLASAGAVFAERGYHGTTLELVAEAADVSETILVKYFEDKPALLRGVLEAAGRATIAHWREAEEPLADPLARFHAVAELVLGDVRSGRVELLLVARLLAEGGGAAVLDPLRSFFGACEAYLAGIIAEGQQAGVFRRAPDPRDGAWLLLHATLGQVATRQLGLTPHGTAESLLEGLMHGLLKTDV